MTINPAYFSLPIVLVRSDKHPVQKNWPDHVVSPADTDRYPDAGLGIKLGPATGLVDIEWDDETGLDTWCGYFHAAPPTVSWKSRRGVHHLFRFTPGQFDGVGKKIDGLEIRCGDRSQSVLPTIDGREWLGDSEVRLLSGNIPFLPTEISNSLPREAIKSEQPEPSDDWDPNSVVEREALPGVDYSSRGDWAELLTPLGWRLVGHEGDKEFWLRPGQTDQKHSATIGHCHNQDDNRCLYIFSTADEIAPFVAHKTYTLFDARALLLHDGDHSACASELRKSGYGTPPNVVAADDEECEEFPVLDPAAFDNVVGRYAWELQSYHAPDPAAVLFQAVDMFGSLVGKYRWYNFCGKRRFVHDFLMLVGDTGSGKGVSFDAAKSLYVAENIEDVFSEVDDLRKAVGIAYTKLNVGRFGSGEGMGFSLQERAKPDYAVKLDGLEYLLEPEYRGCLLITEQEAHGQLVKILQQDSTLGDHFLKVWDSNALSNQTKTGGYIARGPVVTFIGHVVPATIDTLPPDLLFTGLMNRFRFILVPKRRRVLRPPVFPGTRLSEYQGVIAGSLRRIVESGPRKMEFSEDALDVFDAATLFQDSLEGLTAVSHERFTAHMERTAVKLALLAGRDEVTAVDATQARLMQDFVFACTEWNLAEFKDRVRPGVAATTHKRIMDWFAKQPAGEWQSASAVHKGCLHNLRGGAIGPLEELVRAGRLEERPRITAGRTGREFRIPPR